VTAREDAHVAASGGGVDAVLVEPATHYLVARATRPTRAGQRSLGFMLTSVNRDLDSDLAARMLPASAVVGGLDFHRESADRGWRLSGYAVGSRVAGSAAAIDRLQRSSVRYLQRPDATHLAYDPEARSLAGYAAQFQLQKQGGRHWRGYAALFAASPGLETNDLGFLIRSDMAGVNLGASYQQPRPTGPFRSYRIAGLALATTTFGGHLNANTLFFGSSWQLKSFWSVNLNGGFTARYLDDRLTRGGPLAVRPGDGRVLLGVVSDQRKRVTLDVRGYYGADAAGSSTATGTVLFGVRPSPRWSLSAGPNLQRVRSPAQYLTAVDDPFASSTGSRRYVFAPLEQRTVSVDARLALTLTPRLSFDVFVQPFLSGVAYGAPGELRAPRTFEFVRYGQDAGTVERAAAGWRVDPDGSGPAAPFSLRDPDFVQRSLRGNAVLRWEWQPGSTLHVAWQQNREETEPLESLSFGRDARALFGAPSRNVVMVKASYWLNL
jgi:hypothetical protein